MKKPILYLLLIMFAISCKKDDGPGLPLPPDSGIVKPTDPISPVDDSKAIEENVIVKISLGLPEGSSITPEDLMISSLFSDETEASNHGNDVEINKYDEICMREYWPKIMYMGR